VMDETKTHRFRGNLRWNIGRGGTETERNTILGPVAGPCGPTNDFLGSEKRIFCRAAEEMQSGNGDVSRSLHFAFYIAACTTVAMQRSRERTCVAW
jgi:hypothetical protein